jgi:hypothetical protein
VLLKRKWAHMDKWDEKRILILGNTYPSYSFKYTENACTGGLKEDTLEMVRIHPIPLRYLEEGSRFSAFQWIKVRLTKNMSDPRPESYRVDFNSVESQETIPPSRHLERRRLIERSPHFFASLEELKARQQIDGTSLGIVQPREILDCRLEKRPEQERREWLEKEKALLSQEPLFGEKVKPIDFPEVRFLVKWRCEDSQCPTHEMSLLQWGLHELYRKYKGRPDCEQKVLEAMWSRLDLKTKDVFLFLGSFRGHQHNFGLMDSYSPDKQLQGGLFG